MRPFMVEPLVTYLVQRSALIIPAPRTKSAHSEPKAFFRKHSFVMGKRFSIPICFAVKNMQGIHDIVPPNHGAPEAFTRNSGAASSAQASEAHDAKIARGNFTGNFAKARLRERRRL